MNEIIIKKPGRPRKGNDKLVPVWAYVKVEHFTKVHKMISELIKPYR